MPEDLQEKILEEIREGDMINKQKLADLLDTYQYVPLQIKRDKNQS